MDTDGVTQRQWKSWLPQKSPTPRERTPALASSHQEAHSRQDRWTGYSLAVWPPRAAALNDESGKEDCTENEDSSASRAPKRQRQDAEGSEPDVQVQDAVRAIEASPESPAYTKHPKYYFGHGDFFIRINAVMFCVHRHFFVTESKAWKKILNSDRVGRDLKKPFVPGQGKDLKSDHFQSLLWLIYDSPYSPAPAPEWQTWSNILIISKTLIMDRQFELAKEKVKVLTFESPQQKIELCKWAELPPSYAADAYEKLSMDNTPITLADAKELGAEVTWRIFSLRERSARARFTGDEDDKTKLKEFMDTLDQM